MLTLKASLLSEPTALLHAACSAYFLAGPSVFELVTCNTHV